MTTTISVTKAREQFADILNRVCYRGDKFIIEKKGKPVAVITLVDKTLEKSITKKISFAPPVFDMGGEDRIFNRGDIYDN